MMLWIAGAWIAGAVSGFWFATLLTTSSREPGQLSDTWNPPCEHLNWYLHDSMILCRSCQQPMPAVETLLMMLDARANGEHSSNGTPTGRSKPC